MEVVIKEDVVFETENYKVAIGTIHKQLADSEYTYVPGYCIFNKATNVLEVEQSTLPQACLIARRLQEGLDLELSGEAARNELAAKSNLIPRLKN